MYINVHTQVTLLGEIIPHPLETNYAQNFIRSTLRIRNICLDPVCCVCWLDFLARKLTKESSYVSTTRMWLCVCVRVFGEWV